MLCEEYPSLFDNAKVQNNLGECKENREFNFPLTFWGCGFLANCFFCLVSSFLVVGLVLSHLTHESAGERKVVVVIDLILYHPRSKRASWIEDKKKAYRHKYFCDDRKPLNLPLRASYLLIFTYTFFVIVYRTFDYSITTDTFVRNIYTSIFSKNCITTNCKIKTFGKCIVSYKCIIFD